MLHLGSIRGTTIDVDFTFFILLLLFVTMNYDASMGIQYALLWILVVFVSVLIHELAHAATIGLFGFGSSEIVLGGMGGVTMNRRRARPWQDMLISLAGPISSFLLAWICLLLFRNVLLVHTDKMLAALVPILYQTNIWWGLFNLIPLAPLDGGHAIRHFFRMFLREGSAFTIAFWIGMLGGAAVIAWGVSVRSMFLVLFIAWIMYNNFQQWQHFRNHGTPGD